MIIGCKILNLIFLLLTSQPIPGGLCCTVNRTSSSPPSRESTKFLPCPIDCLYDSICLCKVSIWWSHPPPLLFLFSLCFASMQQNVKSECFPRTERQWHILCYVCHLWAFFCAHRHTSVVSVSFYICSCRYNKTNLTITNYYNWHWLNGLRSVSLPEKFQLVELVKFIYIRNYYRAKSYIKFWHF